MAEMLGREIQGLSSLSAFLLAFLGVALMGVIFASVFLINGGTGSGIPRYVWPRRAAVYFVTGAAACLAIFTGLSYAPLSLETSFFLSVLLFSAPHRFIGHGPWLFALSFSTLFFYGYFFAGFTSILILSAAYATGRAMLYKLGRGF